MDKPTMTLYRYGIRSETAPTPVQASVPSLAATLSPGKPLYP
jgi:hypothetical protein